MVIASLIDLMTADNVKHIEAGQAWGGDIRRRPFDAQVCGTTQTRHCSSLAGEICPNLHVLVRADSAIIAILSVPKAVG